MTYALFHFSKKTMFYHQTQSQQTAGGLGRVERDKNWGAEAEKEKPKERSKTKVKQETRQEMERRKRGKAGCWLSLRGSEQSGAFLGVC